MLVSAVSWDLNWFLQFIFTSLLIAVGLHTVVKNTASRYFEVDANFEGDHPADRTPMPGVLMQDPVCAVCGQSGTKKCSRCKAARYCSEACQVSHWKSGHRTKCKDFHQTNGTDSTQTGAPDSGLKNLTAITLVPARGKSRPVKQLKGVLFPYDEFVGFFSRDKLGFPPCGLLNSGNSCFANAVLQCLSFTKPLVAYLLEKGHRGECSLDDWCFLCEFQIHVERARRSSQAFSPMNILSHLPNIGGTLGYGRQEDAHEFMRFAIDTMQSVCLHEFGGEKTVAPSLQETTLIQHIFGGRLQSQVICSKCDKISNQYENMMDLTVEIQGDAASLEECLDQFTVKEWLHGDNMYNCDGCSDYVKAWKRLTVKQAPNILTIVLKRFQSGRFGKLNKRITFPETLDLSRYMSEAGDGSNIYKLYAVVVHLDMLNASYFGHYICCIKDFHGNWYRVDDWKVMRVELEEVLSQEAYMLLYGRFNARPSGLQATESSGKEEQNVKVEVEPSPTGQVAGLSNKETVTTCGSYEVLTSDSSHAIQVSGFENESLNGINQDVKKERTEDVGVNGLEVTSDVANKILCSSVQPPYLPSPRDVRYFEGIETARSNPCSSISEETSGREQEGTNTAESGPSPGLLNDFSCFREDSSVPKDYKFTREDSEHTEVIKCNSTTTARDYANGLHGYVSAIKSAIPGEDGCAAFSGIGAFPTEISSADVHRIKAAGVASLRL
ncbi:ubiquitin carboxyl-terminal hydrolase 18-like [Prosopis cineraria]|uniref:ubiquitin carboxyl-terminal hydrolase 18-like n=1 Tax=Prosopis cineraria TaxID=364024 RepID=UPI00240EC969|nr:ubiquitin carboxyl-terminal hydrolase 18-like [Prosopis cineraria]